MIEQFAQRTALMCPACLCAVYSIEGLVEKESNRPTQVHPRWTVCIESRVVPQHGQKVDYDEAEATQSDLEEALGLVSVQGGTFIQRWVCRRRSAVLHLKWTSDLRHGQGKALDRNICIERLEDVLGHRRLVDAGIFVFMQLWEHALSDVDHLD